MSWDGVTERRKTIRSGGADAELAAEHAADLAVRKVFAILGVDIGSPKEVEEFRKSLRWSDSMRRMADHGWLAAVALLAVAMAAAMWAGVLAAFAKAAGVKG